MAKNPSTRWYWKDWRTDAAVQSCSDAAQGFWAWLLCLCAEADGYLLIAGKPPTIKELARLRGREPRVIGRQLAELERAGVFSRTEDGTIYNRRMVREANDTQCKKTGKSRKIPEDSQPELSAKSMAPRARVPATSSTRTTRSLKDSEPLSDSDSLNAEREGAREEESEDNEKGNPEGEGGRCAPLVVPGAEISALGAEPLGDPHDQRQDAAEPFLLDGKTAFERAETTFEPAEAGLDRRQPMLQAGELQLDVVDIGGQSGDARTEKFQRDRGRILISHAGRSFRSAGQGPGPVCHGSGPDAIVPGCGGRQKSPALKAKIRDQLVQKHARFLMSRRRPEELTAYWTAQLGDDAAAAQRVFDAVDHRMRCAGWDDMRQWRQQWQPIGGIAA